MAIEANMIMTRIVYKNEQKNAHHFRFFEILFGKVD